MVLMPSSFKAAPADLFFIIWNCLGTVWSTGILFFLYCQFKNIYFFIKLFLPLNFRICKRKLNQELEPGQSDGSGCTPPAPALKPCSQEPYLNIFFRKAPRAGRLPVTGPMIEVCNIKICLPMVSSNYCSDWWSSSPATQKHERNEVNHLFCC